MKRNAFACGALILGMVAGFAIRGPLESADAIPPQTQAIAGIEVPEAPTSKPALRQTQLEGDDVHQMFLRIQERTATGEAAASCNYR